MPEKNRVLVVDDITETRENIRKLLQFEADIEVVGAARSGREAVQLSDELKPDVILMDINMPDMDGITATELIRQRSPITQIIILSVQGDPNYMRRAMLAGARDFLTKPPMADELISAVRRAGDMARSERSKAVVVPPLPVNQLPTKNKPGTEGRIIMVYSPKGGTGTTTIAVNLAVTLNNDETQVALVDGNLQFGDVAIFLNEHGKNTIIDLAARSEELDPEIVETVMIKHAGSGLRVLAAPARPEHAENVRSDQFTKVLKYLRQIYSYVVVDATHNLDDITLAALDVCDVLVLVVTQDIPAVKNVRLFLDLMKTIGMSREKLVFVMNKYDKRISITPERIGDNLKQPIVGVITLDEKIVIPAVNRGVPFMVDNKAQPIARTIFSLAETVRAQLAKLGE
jgi:pilus assembly protein CpaE